MFEPSPVTRNRSVMRQVVQEPSHNAALRSTNNRRRERAAKRGL